jgi:hypothetical protein
MIHTSKSVVSDLMEKYKISTFYGIGKLMDKNPQTVANWVNRGSTLDNDSARIAAQLLCLDFEYLLICMEAERAKKNPLTAGAWQQVAQAWNDSKMSGISTLSAIFTLYLLIPDSGLI